MLSYIAEGHPKWVVFKWQIHALKFHKYIQTLFQVEVHFL